MEVQKRSMNMNLYSNVMINNFYKIPENQIYYNNLLSYMKKFPKYYMNNINRNNYIQKNRFFPINQNYNEINPNYTVYNNINVNNNINNYFIIPQDNINYEEYYKNLHKKLNISKNIEVPIFQVKFKLPNKPFYTVIFKIYRNDDLYESLKKFCLENDISEKLVKPLLIQIISSINKFHLLFNQNINNDNFNYLLSLSKEYQKVYKSNE